MTHMTFDDLVARGVVPDRAALDELIAGPILALEDMERDAAKAMKRGRRPERTSNVVTDVFPKVAATG